MAKRSGRGLSPAGGIAFSFAVLLEGVINKDTSTGGTMYAVAGAMLAVAGAGLFFESDGPANPNPRGIQRLAPMTARHVFAGIVLEMAAALSLNILALWLGWLVCERAGNGATSAFALVLFVALIANGLLTYAFSIAMWLTKFVRSREAQGKRIPSWSLKFAAKLEEAERRLTLPPTPPTPVTPPDVDASK